jgi:Ca2+-dependent lipid-binding protein
MINPLIGGLLLKKNENLFSFFFNVPYYSIFNPIEMIFNCLKKYLNSFEINNIKELNKYINNFVKQINLKNKKNNLTKFFKKSFDYCPQWGQ